jgi:hypothetical protein
MRETLSVRSWRPQKASISRTAAFRYLVNGMSKRSASPRKRASDRKGTVMKKRKLATGGKRWQVGDDWSIDSDWSGTAMIYAASGVSSFGISGDYRVSFTDESEPADMRATRLFCASQGESVDEVPDDKLAEELIIIFGAKMTAINALATLKALIARIEDEGLMIGRVGTGDFVHESVGRELTVDDAPSFNVE